MWNNFGKIISKKIKIPVRYENYKIIPGNYFQGNKIPVRYEKIKKNARKVQKIL